MKFTCTKENFTRGLNAVSRIASRTATLPILSNVLIEAKGNSITLLTTNLEIGIITHIRGKVEQPGKLTIQARLLTDVVHLVPEDKIEVEVINQTLVIKSGKTEAKIKGMPAEEFPILPKVESVEPHTLPTTTFKTGAQQVVFAAAADETRPEISGVLFSFTSNTLTLAATDSYRLAEKKLELKGNGPARKIILPSRTVQELLRLLDDTAGESFEALVADNQCLFRLGDTELISRTIEGQYPDYEQILPKESRTTVTVDLAPLVAEVRSASLFCKPGVNDITFAFDDKAGEVVITAVNPQLGEHTGRVPASINGSGMTIVFNSRFVLDGLASLEGQKVKVGLNADAAPGLLVAEGHEEYKYLIMPIRQ